MSHVDDGQLHAYLDGALDEYPQSTAAFVREHLEGCAACAARLEAERRIRGDAEAILGLAVPSVELPSLEELRAYVARTRPAPNVRAVRMYRLGWAASVVLALGTGWMLRGGVTAGPTVRTGPASPEASVAPMTDGPATMVADGVGALDESVGVVEAERSPLDFADGASAQPEAVAEAPVRAMPDGDAPTSGAGAGANAEVLASRVAAVEAAAAGEVSDAGPVEAGERMAGKTRPGDDESPDPIAVTVDADEVAAEMPPPAPAMEPAPAPAEFESGRVAVAEAGPATASGAADSRAGGDEETRRDRAAPSVSALQVRSAMEAGASPVQRVASDDDAPVLSEPSLVVPGLEVVSVSNLGQGTAPWGVHVVQRLEDGSPFELYHLRPEAPLEVVPPRAPEISEARRLTESGWIVIRGPRPTTELETLLDRLFPEG